MRIFANINHHFRKNSKTKTHRYALINFNLLFARRSNNPLIQLFRYFLVGGVCFLADFGLMVALTEIFGLNYLLSASLSFCVGLTLNYLLSISWVFDRHAASHAEAMRDFAGFALIGVIGLGLNAAIMWAATDVASLHYTLSKIVSTGVVFGWNFIARRCLTSQSTERALTSNPQKKSICQTT